MLSWYNFHKKYYLIGGEIYVDIFWKSEKNEYERIIIEIRANLTDDKEFIK